MKGAIAIASMISTMTSRQADKYRLNYVEVEIGPPKRREGGEIPLLKVGNGSKNRVNYSTIVFPASKNEHNKCDGIKTVPLIPPHQQSLLSQKGTTSGKGANHLPTRVNNSVAGIVVGGRTSNGNGNHSKLERKGSRITEAQQQQQQLETPTTPPGSPPRRRALSTPTRSRKFPNEAEIDDTTKTQQDKPKDSPVSKTRTLPPREKLWDPEALEQDFGEDQHVSSGKKPETQKPHTHDADMLSNSASSYKLTQAMQAMRMKVRRKSSLGEGYEIVNEPIGILKMTTQQQQDQPPASPGTGDTPPLSPESPLKSSPVMKRHRTELEKAFARRKLTGRISGEPEGYIPHSSSGESSPQEGVPSQFSDASSAGTRFVPVLPMIKSSRDRGQMDGQKTASGEYRYVDNQSTRKPIPAPRFGQSRESSVESITDSVYLAQRPMPSPPSGQTMASTDPTASQQTDDTYMNVAFGKQKPDSHRYENVFLDDRTMSLDHCSNTSDSPRDSLEIHSNRPIPAPRHHSSSGNLTSDQDIKHKSSSQHQQGKQHGHTRQGSYGSTAAIFSHINTTSVPVLPSCPNKTKQNTGQSGGSNSLYAIPCRNGMNAAPSSNHGQTPMKASHGIAPEVPVTPKPEIPSHGCFPRRDSHGSTGSSGGCKVSDLQQVEKSSSISKSISHLLKDSERREKKHHKSHGDKKSREDRKGHGERKGRHGEKGDREKRGHGKRHRGDNASHSSAHSSKSKPERPSYGNQPWYYGRMLRQECEYLMLSQGQSCQYLVRDSSHRTGDLMLSVLYGQKVHHYVIQTTPNNKFHIAHHDFNKVEDILEFYHHHVIMYSPEREPVYLTEPFILKHK
ncbi:uncharacterized protein [Asterias amurensis]|uniref:uncharacterized protein isoform X1 n=1 Tax=Asterias amurensis TaxID=7602 RepID=UPI003AB33889